MKHFSQEDVMKLKEQEQAGSGGCLAELFGNLLVFGVIAILITAALAFASAGGPATAVPTTATAIYGPTLPQLADTPTLAPTAAPPSALIELEPADTAVPTPLPTALPTYTPLPTHTPQATYTPAATHTPAPTYTPLPTWTPMATWTAVPPYLVADYTADLLASRAAVTRLTWLALAFIGLALFAFAFAIFRPTDRDLRRLYRLLEMHLLTILAQAGIAPPTPTHAPVRALPAPVRTTGAAPVTPVTPVQNTGAAPPETIVVSVQPVGEGMADRATMQAICDLWNEIAERGERPSFNRVCIEYFGSKNSDRLAIVRRAVKWGREQGEVLQ